MANLDAYRAMRAEATRRKLPRLYKEDLTKHDRAILSRINAPERFGWVLRTNGTHLIRPDRNAAGAIHDIDQNFESNEKHYYWWNGDTLQEMPAGNLIRRLQDEARRA